MRQGLLLLRISSAALIIAHNVVYGWQSATTAIPTIVSATFSQKAIQNPYTIRPIAATTSSHRFTTHFRQASSALFQSANSSGSNGRGLDDRRRGGNGKRNNLIFRVVRRLSLVPPRLWARFSKLSKKAKRRLVIFWFCIVVSTRFLYASQTQMSVAPPPVEISYSTFLKLVEDQTRLPVEERIRMDQVRIGTDRINYRLAQPLVAAVQQEQQQQQGAATAPSSSSTIGKVARSAGESLQRLTGQTKKSPTIPERSVSEMAGVGALAADTKATRPVTPHIRAYTRKVSAPPELISSLRENDISFAALPPPKQSTVSTVVRTSLVAFYFLILFRLYRGLRSTTQPRSPGKLVNPEGSERPTTTFDDIQGIDQAKFEVMELVDVLKNPSKYAILGARAPTGLLLEGPPGTGKTLLARATANTAGVPLLSCSGSDFIELYVGQGAARVRGLFERAQKIAPCLIFIDELDSLGKARDNMSGLLGGGLGRANSEAEQTLNQLLVCMDGLDSSRRICVMAATNRKEVLDQALVRPGRFDRIVTLQLPNQQGRESILRVHAQKIPGFQEGQGVDPTRPNALGKGQFVDLSAIAAVTDGFSGAELELLVNEAAIRAVRRLSALVQKDPQPNPPPLVTVQAIDFEESLASFMASRGKVGGRGVGAATRVANGDLLKNLWK